MDVPEHARKGKSTNPTSVSPLLLIRDIAGERQVSLNGDSVSIGRSRDNDVEIEDISSSQSSEYLAKSEQATIVGHVRWRCLVESHWVWMS